jgi:2,4-dienoyl-CoA reductase-like NADH-dependent reductase (Old Yellow Enzyme family)
VVGPSGGLSWDGKDNEDPSGGYYVPREMTKYEIEELISNYASAAERAVDAGVDVVEIHAAHGYLIHQFLSPLTNRRSDGYGGGFENRVRLLVEVIRAVRKRIPATMPVFVRISLTDWMEDTSVGRELGSWDEESTVQLAKMLPALGVDLVDLSSGGNHHLARFNVFDGGKKHTAIARRIKQSLVSQRTSLLVGTVGMITEAKQARDLVQGDKEGNRGVDIVSIGRQFLRQPDWVLNAAAEIGVDVVWPAQIERIRPVPTARI